MYWTTSGSHVVIQGSDAGAGTMAALTVTSKEHREATCPEMADISSSCTFKSRGRRVVRLREDDRSHVA